VQYEVKKGEYYIQRAGLAQNGLVPSDAAKYYYVHFYGDFVEGEGLPLRGNWSPEKIMPLLEGMEGGAENGKHHLQKSLAFYNVLNELYKESRPSDRLPAREIMDYIRAHYRERITVSELASRFYMSDNYLILTFRRQYGITPYKYITKLRLEKAVELLKNTTRSEDEIAFSLGFSDFSVFYKAFCAKFGCPPSAMRK
jgi:AraC-like DNA-binding protein